MKRATLIVAAVLAFSSGMTAESRRDPVAWLSARAVQMTSPMRLDFPRLDIRIYQWSSDLDHRTLARTILERGPVAFSHALAGYGRAGWITMADEEFAIRYAWEVRARDGARRIYLASDQPFRLMTREFRRFADADPLLFMELRLNTHGDGVGRLSDAAGLSVDESRNVIELREWDRRPLHLVMVHDEVNIYD